MNLQDFVDFGADILNNFMFIPESLLETTVFDTPLWTIVLGSGLAVYLVWLISKWVIGLS